MGKISAFITFVLLALSLFASPAVGQPKSKGGGKIDINNASQEQLEQLEGIGPVTAHAIIAARPFHSLNELTNAGMSEARVEKLKPMLLLGRASKTNAMHRADADRNSVSGRNSRAEASASREARSNRENEIKPAKRRSSTEPRPGVSPSLSGKVNLNTASKEQLEALPGIGPVKAQAIIDARPFKSIEDIKKVKGIKEGIFEEVRDQISVQ